MARIFALADLHLSLGGDKPMDVFGEQWRDHAARMADNWDAAVEPDDTVLLPGDLSWARSLAAAMEDLRWIGQRPGRKLLLRGNHDGWWGGIARVREALPSGCEALHNNAFRVGEWVVIGSRGWTGPDDPTATAGDGLVFNRELERLRLSMQDGRRQFGDDRPRLAMTHYPPWIDGREPGPVVELLKEAGVRVCVFGHLHGDDHGLAVTGERGGIAYRLVASDAVGFVPVEIELARG